MKRRAILILVPAFAILLTVLPGCGYLETLLQLNTTAVQLVNDSDFNVQVVLYYDDDQNLPRAVLTEVGTQLEFTLIPGESRTFTRSCDDLQAIVIDDADLMVVGQIGPETDSDVLRDGTDFGCGDTIRFTFAHSDILTDFDVAVSVIDE